MTNIRSREAGIAFEVAEGCEVLVAKAEDLSRVLNERVEEIRREREYLEEGRIWLRAE